METKQRDGPVRRVRPVPSLLALLTIAATIPGMVVGDAPPPSAKVARQATLLFPLGLVHDGGSSLYVAERRGNRVWMVDLATGTAGTVAGTGSRGFSGDGGPAAQADLSGPTYLAISPAGDLHIADTFNHRIRSVDRKTGIISTVVGTGEAGFGGDGGPAASAAIRSPYGLLFDDEGHLIFADTDNHRIRKVDAATRVITTLAGTGEGAYGGDGGPATRASLNRPHVITRLGRDLIVGDSFNHRIRRIDHETGLISTLAGTGEEGLAAPGASLLEAPFRYFGELAPSPAGGLLVTEWGNDRIVRLDVDGGKLRRVAGDGMQEGAREGGPAERVRISKPAGIAVDAKGNIFFVEAEVDGECGRIRRIDVDTGSVSTVAGAAC